MQNRGFEITGIKKGSPAEKAGLKAGDKLLQINGSIFFDIVDYRILTAAEKLYLSVLREGKTLELELNKRFDEDPGIVFSSFTLSPLRRCQNHCVFCFIDQQPEGMREPLYEKDDDYRLSFFHGNYITLTNVSNLEMKRIIRRNLSPLYISIHAVDPRVRRRMMRNSRAANIFQQLKKLARAGIEMHGQVVICPGINDGAVLSQTVEALSALYPNLNTLALVPVGLTKYRQGSKQLRSITPEEAERVVEKYTAKQRQFEEKMGTPFVYLADELYLLSGNPLPSHEHYGDYLQLENGVGIARLFLNELEEWKQKTNIPHLNKDTKISIVTASSGEPFIKQFVEELNKISNLQANLYTVPHEFWGGNVSVAGLLTGTDLLSGLKGKELGDILFIPETMLKEKTLLFLDNLDVSTLSTRLNAKVIPVNNLFQINKYLLRNQFVKAKG